MVVFNKTKTHFMNRKSFRWPRLGSVMKKIRPWWPGLPE